VDFFFSLRAEVAFVRGFGGLRGLLVLYSDKNNPFNLFNPMIILFFIIDELSRSNIINGCFFSLRSKIFYHRIERIERIISCRLRKGICVICLPRNEVYRGVI